MREIKLLLDDDVEFVTMQARVLDEEGFTTKEIKRIFNVSKDVFDMREKAEDKPKWKLPLKGMCRMSRQVMIVYPQFMDCELKATNYAGESYVFTNIDKGWDFQEYLNKNMDLSGLKGRGQLLWTNNSIEIDLPEKEWDKVVEDWSFPKEDKERAE